MGIRFRKTKKSGPLRFSLTKRGIGWGIGNKYIGYSHGASGRNSLRASIPGTGLSYITQFGGKSKRRKGSVMSKKIRNVKVTTEIIDHTSQYQLQKADADAQKRKKRNDKIALGTIAGCMTLIIAAGVSGSMDQDAPPASSAKTYTSETLEAILETQNLSENISAEETDPAPAKPEQKPEPEPEPKPEPKPEPPKTEATITITHNDSSMTAEMVQQLAGNAVFWAPTGTRMHITTECWSLDDVVYAGTYEDAAAVKEGGWCGSCSKAVKEYTGHNKNATAEVLASCYTYTDFISQIPSAAFS